MIEESKERKGLEQQEIAMKNDDFENSYIIPPMSKDFKVFDIPQDVLDRAKKVPIAKNSTEKQISEMSRDEFKEFCKKIHSAYEKIFVIKRDPVIEYLKMKFAQRGWLLK